MLGASSDLAESCSNLAVLEMNFLGTRVFAPWVNQDEQVGFGDFSNVYQFGLARQSVVCFAGMPKLKVLWVSISCIVVL